MTNQLNILIVDDDPVDSKTVHRILDNAGLSHRIDEASSLAEAKQKVRDCHYDAVIFDLGLPDSQGTDGIVEFQATAPELPIVVLTGCADEVTALKSVDIGAEDFLNKQTMTEAGLCRSLHYAIERHRRSNEAYRNIDSLRLSLNDAVAQANTDPLTCLPNRRGLQTYLDHVTKAHPQQPFIVGVTDLDHFKSVNDNYGHNAGDNVLREFASRLQYCMRNEDFACRVGGDEFVIIFGGLNQSEAGAVGRRIIEHVSSNPVTDSGGKIPVSATLAMAEIEPPFLGLEQILLQTHTLLLNGKTHGGNRLESAWDSEAGRTVGSGPHFPTGVDRRSEDILSENSLLQYPRPAKTLSTEGISGYHVLFGLGQQSWPLAAPAISRARIANCLSEMTLMEMRRAQSWRLANAPGLLLHLDIEADAIKPWVCVEMNHIFKTEEERNTCILFFHTDFQNHSGEVSISDLKPLRQSGFKIGVRSVGDGSTNLEHLQLLSPDWIRFDPAITINVGLYKKKAIALTQIVNILWPLKAQLAADETEIPNDLKLLRELGFSAYYSNQ